jgi:hypothetical protein
LLFAFGTTSVTGCTSNNSTNTNNQLALDQWQLDQHQQQLACPETQQQLNHNTNRLIGLP